MRRCFFYFGIGIKLCYLGFRLVGIFLGDRRIFVLCKVWWEILCRVGGDADLFLVRIG